MEENDILKYSQQIIAYLTETDYNIANGFFVRYNGYPYFITVNHATAPDLKQLDTICLVLHINATGLATRAIKIDRWQYIDLYKFHDNVEKFALPYFDERIDLAFCSANKEDFEKSVVELDHRLVYADSSSCHHKSFAYIQLPSLNMQPTTEGEYYMAGKILFKKGTVMWEYKSYFYSGMKYLGQEERDHLYEFQIPQPANIEDFEGLSGTPILDADMNFIGIAIKYRDYDNVLRVLPAEDIVDFLKNDCSPSLEETDLS